MRGEKEEESFGVSIILESVVYLLVSKAQNILAIIACRNHRIDSRGRGLCPFMKEHLNFTPET